MTDQQASESQAQDWARVVSPSSSARAASTPPLCSDIIAQPRATSRCIAEVLTELSPSLTCLDPSFTRLDLVRPARDVGYSCTHTSVVGFQRTGAPGYRVGHRSPTSSVGIFVVVYRAVPSDRRVSLRYLSHAGRLRGRGGLPRPAPGAQPAIYLESPRTPQVRHSAGLLHVVFDSELERWQRRRRQLVDLHPVLHGRSYQRIRPDIYPFLIVSWRQRARSHRKYRHSVLSRHADKAGILGQNTRRPGCRFGWTDAERVRRTPSGSLGPLRNDRGYLPEVVQCTPPQAPASAGI